jgi:hypothetical protein
MPLSNDYSWKAFKKTTNIKLSSRGKNMEAVDIALKSYWEGRDTGAAQTTELANLLALVKACTSWLKLKQLKKESDVAGDKKAKSHFQTRWNAVVALGKASLEEARRLVAVVGDATTKAALAYEKRKGQTVTQGGRDLRSLQGGYAMERTQYVESGKAGHPVSASEVHWIQENEQRFRKNYGEKYGAVFRKPFEALSTADYQMFEQFMNELEQNNPERKPFKHHVCFLRKADRLQHMALVENGRLMTPDGRPWDTGGNQMLYAMDEYGNLFIMSAGEYDADRMRTNHSSILAGKDVLCAGELEVQAGRLVYIANTSGHYKPGQNNLYLALRELADQGVLLGATKCDIMVTERSGWRDVPAFEVIQAAGNLPVVHPKAFGLG